MSTYHQIRAERTMTAWIALRDPSELEDLEIDEETGEYVDPAVAAAAVPCRITTMASTAGDHLQDAGDTMHTVIGYQVAVPLGTVVNIGDRGTVTHTGDALLDGRDFRVDEVILGSQLVERRLRCSLMD